MIHSIPNLHFSVLTSQFPIVRVLRLVGWASARLHCSSPSEPRRCGRPRRSSDRPPFTDTTCAEALSAASDRRRFRPRGSIGPVRPGRPDVRCRVVVLARPLLPIRPLPRITRNVLHWRLGPKFLPSAHAPCPAPLVVRKHLDVGCSQPGYRRYEITSLVPIHSIQPHIAAGGSEASGKLLTAFRRVV